MGGELRHKRSHDGDIIFSLNKEHVVHDSQCMAVQSKVVMEGVGALADGDVGRCFTEGRVMRQEMHGMEGDHEC